MDSTSTPNTASSPFSASLPGAEADPSSASSPREVAVIAKPVSATLAPPKRTLMDRMDAFISRLSTRSNFWHRVCSIIWLPYAARSGIRMKRVDENTFSAVLPFTRFNKNWYNAMAGAVKCFTKSDASTAFFSENAKCIYCNPLHFAVVAIGIYRPVELGTSARS